MAKTTRKKAKKKSSSKKRTSRKTAKRKTTRRKHVRRTVMYSRGGKKLYAVRRDGKFTDIQRYSRAHAQDIKRRAKDEA